MIFINFTGLDTFLIGEFDKRFHSKIANAYGVSDEDLLITGIDSYAYYKGIEQTSYNLICKIEAPYDYESCEVDIKELLVECSKDYSMHIRIIFSYFEEEHYYENVNKEYPEFLVYDETQEDEDYEDAGETTFSEDGDTANYNGQEVYLGNVFKDKNINFDEEDDSPRTIDDFFKKKQ